jgi:deoxyribodipyrimidine photolyase-related protein
MAERGIRVERIPPAGDSENRALRAALSAGGVGILHAADPAEEETESRIRVFCKRNGVALVFHESPAFILPRTWLDTFFEGRETFRMAEFYRAVRKEKGLLLDAGGKPMGGKWSFDPENRLRFPKGIPIPRPWGSEKREEALRLPQTRKEAEAALHDFMENRIGRFGDYEDAMSEKEPVLWHSVLSPAMNVGLLTPGEVLEALAERHAENPVPLNSLEGFTRQVAGWREFMRAVYRRAGPRQKTSNAMDHFFPLPKGFPSGETGLRPVDTVVARVKRHGYAHHIERLMILGNFLLLCETDPRAVTGWFMSRFADATDWAMVPNVFGMSQFADGGLMTTKPYCSGSAYLLRMGDFPRGPWCGDWDALFWRFVSRHRELFARNPRTSVMARQLDRISPVRLGELISRADTLLKKFHE